MQAPHTPSPEIDAKTTILQASAADLWAALRVRRTWVWPAAVLLVGAGITVWTTNTLNRQIDEGARGEFTRLAQRVEIEIQRHMSLPDHGLKGLRGTYATTRNQVDSEQFKASVASCDLSKEFPAVKGFGFIECVRRADVSRYEAAAQAEGPPDFQVKTESNTADLFVVRHIEPMQDNLTAAGSDLTDSADTRTAIEDAVIGGYSTATPLISVQSGPSRDPGLLVFLPVYKTGASFDNEEDRWGALRGVLYAPILATELFQGVLNAAQGNVSVEIFDGPVNQPDKRLYASEQLRDTSRGTAQVGAFETAASLTMGQRA